MRDFRNQAGNVKGYDSTSEQEEENNMACISVICSSSDEVDHNFTADVLVKMLWRLTSGGKGSNCSPFWILYIW